MKPSVSRIVHYHDGDQGCLAAIVTKVQGRSFDPVTEAPSVDNWTLSLCVLTEFGMRFERGVVMQELPKVGPPWHNTWHWPERVEE